MDCLSSHRLGRDLKSEDWDGEMLSHVVAGHDRYNVRATMMRR
jgi:hypothetical protein